MLASLDHIDFTIHVFNAGCATETIRNIPPLRHGFRGGSQKTLLNTLREADKPISTEDLGTKLMAERGVDPEDPDLRAFSRRRACASLQHLRNTGVARHIKPGHRRYV